MSSFILAPAIWHFWQMRTNFTSQLNSTQDLDPEKQDLQSLVKQQPLALSMASM